MLKGRFDACRRPPCHAPWKIDSPWASMPPRREQQQRQPQVEMNKNKCMVVVLLAHDLCIHRILKTLQEPHRDGSSWGIGSCCNITVQLMRRLLVVPRRMNYSVRAAIQVTETFCHRPECCKVVFDEVHRLETNPIGPRRLAVPAPAPRHPLALNDWLAWPHYLRQPFSNWMKPIKQNEFHHYYFLKGRNTSSFFWGGGGTHCLLLQYVSGLEISSP
jgi:hypothetical protein